MIHLHALHMNNIPRFLEIRNECADSLHDNRRFSLLDVLEWWKKEWGSYPYASLSDNRYFSITTDSGDMVGYVRVICNDRQHSVCVGVDIHADHRRKGYAFAAYQALFDMYFSRGAVNRIELEVLADNKPAIRLYEKLGFQVEGTKREAVCREDSRYVDSIMMSILRDQWKDLPK